MFKKYLYINVLNFEISTRRRWIFNFGKNIQNESSLKTSSQNANFRKTLAIVFVVFKIIAKCKTQRIFLCISLNFE